MEKAIIVVLALILILWWIKNRQENLVPVPPPKIYYFYSKDNSECSHCFTVLNHIRSVVKKHKAFEVTPIEVYENKNELDDLMSKYYVDLEDIPSILIVDHLGDTYTRSGGVQVQNVVVKMGELGKAGKKYNLITYLKTGEKTQKHYSAVRLDRELEKVRRKESNLPGEPVMNKPLVFLFINEEDCVECDVIVNHFNKLMRDQTAFEHRVLDTYYDWHDVKELNDAYNVSVDTMSLPALLVVDRDNRHVVFYGSQKVQTKFIKLSKMAPEMQQVHDMIHLLSTPGMPRKAHKKRKKQLGKNPGKERFAVL